MTFSRRPRRAYRTAATVAASVLTVSLAAADAAPASAAPADRSDLPLQTQIIGGFWDGVRPLLDVQNPADDQSFYDSANPLDNPSRMIAGNLSPGGLIPAFETSFLVPAPALGHPVVVADTQGKDANFAAGPAYGTATLDSLRAATAAETSPITPTDQIGLFGYSGGAIASNWAAIRAEEYAPEIEQRIVGVAQGGVLVDPQKNLSYAGDGLLWSGVVGLALTALGDAYDIDFSQYFNDYGMAVAKDVRDLSIVDSVARYPGLHWSDLAKPEYPTPQDAPEVKAVIDDVNMGNWGSPRIPMFVNCATVPQGNEL